jgi:hypothetical protein
MTRAVESDTSNSTQELLLFLYRVKYRKDWDLSSIPIKLLLREAARRAKEVSSIRGRPEQLAQCAFCSEFFGSARMRSHLPSCRMNRLKAIKSTCNRVVIPNAERGLDYSYYIMKVTRQYVWVGQNQETRSEYCVTNPILIPISAVTSVVLKQVGASGAWGSRRRAVLHLDGKICPYKKRTWIHVWPDGRNGVRGRPGYRACNLQDRGIQILVKPNSTPPNRSKA